MKYIWTIIIALTIIACKTQELQPKIATDQKDIRLASLYGKWYFVRAKEEIKIIKFTRQLNDSAEMTVEFFKKGTYILFNKNNKDKPKTEGKWFLVKDKLYYENSNTYKGDASVVSIITLTDTLLEYKYNGKTKNIYESFLCGDDQTYSITEVLPKYGTTNKDFENYFYTNLKLSEQAKTFDTDCVVEFTINCNGEVSEVRPFIEKKTEFEKAIVTLLRQMPKWTPATMRGKTVNFSKKYKFSYQSGQLKIREG